MPLDTDETTLCRAANRRLDHALGPQLVKRYGAGTLAADVPHMQADAQLELWNSNDTDIEKISNQMVSLRLRPRSRFRCWASGASSGAAWR
ncbi:hypothetical protein ACFQHO_04835 [Actinomadura yumaensis]|uniref:Uncharacterized protein n=1 Tax=Actinomadura yumaensis TaxID=111807 RepID=A0ABW2CJD9_9ACTN|nr:hypothetical protein [Actinomadura sp. J1-007]MWK37886.1 hypothetical protein [Actinomadura sp. J1-007]